MAGKSTSSMFDQYLDNEYLKGSDVGLGKTVSFEISKVSIVHSLDGQEKLECTITGISIPELDGKTKWSVNKGNARSLQELCGNDPLALIGKRVALVGVPGRDLQGKQVVSLVVNVSNPAA